METLPLHGLPRQVPFERYGGGPASLESLTTEHVTETDLARIVEICNQPKVQTWVTSRYATGPNSRYTEQDALAFVTMAYTDWALRQAFPYIIRNEDGKLMGTIGLRSADKAEPEVGYWADTDEGAGGYVTNALFALCEMAAKRGYAGLCAYAMPDNDSSRNVLKRAGFSEKGLMPYLRAGDNLVVEAVKYVRKLDAA